MNRDLFKQNIPRMSMVDTGDYRELIDLRVMMERGISIRESGAR